MAIVYVSGESSKRYIEKWRKENEWNKDVTRADLYGTRVYAVKTVALLEDFIERNKKFSTNNGETIVRREVVSERGAGAGTPFLVTWKYNPNTNFTKLYCNESVHDGSMTFEIQEIYDCAKDMFGFFPKFQHIEELWDSPKDNELYVEYGDIVVVNIPRETAKIATQTLLPLCYRVVRK